MPADLTVEEVRQSRTAFQDVRLKTEPLRILLDLNVASTIDPDLGRKLPKNLAMIEQAHSMKPDERPNWWNLVQRAVSLGGTYRAFHWEFEFPDAFSEDRRGFDLVVTNPPWDAVKPEDDDFFSEYYTGLRRIADSKEKQKIIKTLLKSSEIADLYHAYRESIEQKVAFYKQSGQYVMRGSGDTNFWKLFLERVLKVLADTGSFALVIPSGIVADEGGKQLREALFRGRIRAMYEFENRNGIFEDVHRSYKFVLLTWDKTVSIPTFPAAFYLHDIQALDGKTERDKFIEMPFELIRKCSPDSLSIPEVRNRQQLQVFTRIYERHHLLKDIRGWTVTFVRELDRANDSDLFNPDSRGWPLVEGKNFHQFLPDFEKIAFTVDPKAGLQRTGKHREYRLINEEIHRRCRLVFRDVASSTNVRATIACIIQPKTFTPHTAIVVLPIVNDSIPKETEYDRVICYLAGIFNSFVFDFLVRTRVTMHLSYFHMYQTPVPSEIVGKTAEKIANISARLSCLDERYSGIGKALGIEPHVLTMNERVNLTSELNVLVANLYGLSRHEVEVVLNSFDGFEEDGELLKLASNTKWDDHLIRRFNGEVRKRVLSIFDSQGLD